MNYNKKAIIAEKESICQHSKTFVEIVYDMLEDAEHQGFSAIVRWGPDGKTFKVHDAKLFETQIQPYYYNQTKLRSFQRKLISFGFTSVPGGPLRGSYWHQYFLRGRRDMCFKIEKVGSPNIKSTKKALSQTTNDSVKQQQQTDTSEIGAASPPLPPHGLVTTPGIQKALGKKCAEMSLAEMQGNAETMTAEYEVKPAAVADRSSCQTAAVMQPFHSEMEQDNLSVTKTLREASIEYSGYQHHTKGDNYFSSMFSSQNSNFARDSLPAEALAKEELLLPSTTNAPNRNSFPRFVSQSLNRDSAYTLGEADQPPPAFADIAAARAQLMTTSQLSMSMFSMDLDEDIFDNHQTKQHAVSKSKQFISTQQSVPPLLNSCGSGLLMSSDSSAPIPAVPIAAPRRESTSSAMNIWSSFDSILSERMSEEELSSGGSVAVPGMCRPIPSDQYRAPSFSSGSSSGGSSNSFASRPIPFGR